MFLMSITRLPMSLPLTGPNPYKPSGHSPAAIETTNHSNVHCFSTSARLRAFGFIQTHGSHLSHRVSEPFSARMGSCSAILSRSGAPTGSYSNEAFEGEQELIGSVRMNSSSLTFLFAAHAISASGLFGFSLTPTTLHLFETSVVMKGTFSGGKQ